MLNTYLKKISNAVLNFLSLALLLNTHWLNAQNKDNNNLSQHTQNLTLNTQHSILSTVLIPSYASKFQYEIGEIKFIGNHAYSNSELLSKLISRPTDRTYEHRILLYYDVQLKYPYARKIIPPLMINSFDKALETMINEVQFFEQAKAENDVLAIQDFYNQNGFHKAKVSYTFESDLASQINVLTFYIDEDSVSTISSIKYYGIDSLPNDLVFVVKSLMNVRAGERFNELRIFNEIRNIHFKLLDNGYYFAKYEQPLVLKDTILNQDSIIINFHIGTRQKITSVIYVDSTKGQNLVVNEMKDKQLDFKIGDWYSISKINRSSNNLLSLGTFDIVNIDTSSIFKKQTDSTLSMLVFTQYRKQQEWGAGLYVNRTAIDNFTNFGLELAYSHKNFGGVAQNFNIFFRPEFRDISRIIQEGFKLSKADFQLQAGISLAQPLLFVIDRARFGFAGQIIYSYSKIFSDLQLSTISAPIKFPVKFPEFTFFQFGSIDFLVEKQVPLNFDNAYQNELNKTDSLAEKEKIKESFKIYESLDRYNKKHKYEPSAYIFTGSIIGDKRNDIFNPSDGYYVNLSADGTIPGLGIADFVRVQLSYYFFCRLSPTTIFALKARGGVTVWGDQKDTYVPIERQFFAGGANSVRGWSSRRLRYPQPKVTAYPENTLDFFQDFVGSGTIIEGSLELRFRFPKPANFDKFLSEIISNIGLTAFLDLGNTFHWYSDYNYNYNWYDYFTKLAVAGGAGIGYMTPVGPFRVDIALPLYDPSAKKDKTIITRENVIKDLKVHIGLGYSF